MVEFSADLLFFRPKEAGRARGTVFLEVVNRGRDQSLAIMSGAQQRDLSPESWDLGDRFLLEQGFAVAFLGWQFDVQPSRDSRSRRRSRRSKGSCVKATSKRAAGATIEFGFAYCASTRASQSATLTFRARMDETPQPLPRDDVAVCRGRVLGASGHGRRRRPLRSACTRRKVRRWPASAWRPFATSRRISDTAPPAPAARNAVARSSGSSATATRRADASSASSFATASTPTSAAGRRSMR